MDLYYVILLGVAVSMDGFFAGIAYGIKKISIPILSLITIGAATLFYTALASYGSGYFALKFDPRLTTIIGSLLLIGIGALSVFKQVFSRRHHTGKQKSFLAFDLPTDNIVLNIMDKPEQADIDHSNHLSLPEALLLGTVLGIDNMVATFAAGLTTPLPFYTPFAMCLIQTILLYGGIMLSQKIIDQKEKESLVYLPGILLILIGLFRMI